MIAITRSVIFLSIFLVACTHQQAATRTDTSAVPAPESQVDTKDNYWWYARFEMDWDEEKPPDFSQNLIIAHEVVAPMLVRYSDEIVLWRFHRRAARDEAGHQFSFIFYAAPAAAQNIFNEIRASTLVEDLLNSGDLIELRLDDPSRPQKASIAATSDSNWPETIQNSWPYFIMGVSLMWLDLLEQLVDPGRISSLQGISERLDYYKDANEELTDLWKQTGRHALFHHINAIYGYEPLELVF